MSNLLSQIGNKINYSISRWASDPEADQYAQQQAIQAQQDAEAQERLNEAKSRADADSKAKRDADAKAQSLADRSNFKPMRAGSNIASGILKWFMRLILLLLILYGGHLAANEAIGYNAPFRLLSFYYGCVFFFIEIPKMLIRRYWYQIKPSYFTYLPLSTYLPNGDMETFFLGAFCYKEDEASIAARAKVESMYRAAFDKTQIKTV